MSSISIHVSIGILVSIRNIELILVPIYVGLSWGTVGLCSYNRSIINYSRHKLFRTLRECEIVGKQQQWLNVRVRVRKTSEGKVEVTFGYFDIYPNIVIDVTDRLSAVDKDDFERLVYDEDPFVMGQILMETREFLQVQEDLGMKLALELRRTKEALYENMQNSGVQ